MRVYLYRTYLSLLTAFKNTIKARKMITKSQWLVMNATLTSIITTTNKPSNKLHIHICAFCCYFRKFSARNAQTASKWGTLDSINLEKKCGQMQIKVEQII